MSFFLNSLVKPLSSWPISSQRRFVSSVRAKDLPAMGTILGKNTKYFFVALCLFVSIGFLYTKNRDAGLVAAVVIAYLGLFYAWRKAQGVKNKGRYPIIHYRGHPVRKKKFFL